MLKKFEKPKVVKSKEALQKVDTILKEKPEQKTRPEPKPDCKLAPEIKETMKDFLICKRRKEKVAITVRVDHNIYTLFKNLYSQIPQKIHISQSSFIEFLIYFFYKQTSKQ